MMKLTRVLTLLVLATATLSACGNDKSASSGSAPGSPENPLVAQTPAAEAPQSGSSPASGSTHQKGSGKSNSQSKSSAPATGEPSNAAGKAPGYDTLVDRQTSHPQSRFTPCNLVSESQARDIVGAQMQQPVEAPQGPTCIYRSRTGKDFISLAVQSASYAKLKQLVRKPQPVTVSGRSGICGKVGSSTLYVPLGGNRVLSVGASCDIAQQFAAKAVPRLD